MNSKESTYTDDNINEFLNQYFEYQKTNNCNINDCDNNFLTGNLSDQYVSLVFQFKIKYNNYITLLKNQITQPSLDFQNDLAGMNSMLKEKFEKIKNGYLQVPNEWKELSGGKRSKRRTKRRKNKRKKNRSRRW